jgi:hypothetical protein
MKWMYYLYTTGPGQRKEIHASPLQASVEQLKGLPPALIQVAESTSCATKVRRTVASWTKRAFRSRRFVTTG